MNQKTAKAFWRVFVIFVAIATVLGIVMPLANW
jgi:cytochrome bd-type quinol oxidase subunit 1